MSFEIPTTGTFKTEYNSNVVDATINSSKLQGVMVYGWTLYNSSSSSFKSMTVKAGTDTRTYTSVEYVTVSAPSWTTTISNLPSSRTNPTTNWTYTVEEVKPSGAQFEVTYTGDRTDITGGTVTATNTNQVTNITVNKEWAFKNGSTEWPEGVTVGVQLYDGDTAVAGKSDTLSASNTSTTFTNLPSGGSYSVKETVSPAGSYIPKIARTGDTFTITNVENSTDVTVQKTWETAPAEPWTVTFKLQRSRVQKIAFKDELLAAPVNVEESWEDVLGQANLTVTDSAPSKTIQNLPLYERQCHLDRAETSTIE